MFNFSSGVRDFYVDEDTHQTKQNYSSLIFLASQY